MSFSNPGKQNLRGRAVRDRAEGASLLDRAFARGVKPLRAGIGASAVALLIMVAAFNTGTNLLYVMGSTLLGLGTLSLALGGLNLRGIAITRRFPSDIHAGTESEVQIEASHPKAALGHYGLVVSRIAPGSASADAVHFISIEPGKTQRGTIKVRFARRGRFGVGPMLLSTCFPFGFLEFWTRRGKPAEVIVFPRLVSVAPALRRVGSLTGDLEIQKKGSGISLFSIRPYQPGDPARSIHWKLSAKGGGLLVREYEAEDMKKIRLVLDFHASASPTTDEIECFENAISLTASLARHFINRDYEVGLLLPTGPVEPAGGREHLRAMMRRLALAEIERFDRPVAPLDSEAECAEIWIGPRAEASAHTDKTDESPGARHETDARRRIDLGTAPGRTIHIGVGSADEAAAPRADNTPAAPGR